MTTVVCEQQESTFAGTPDGGGALWVSNTDLERATGFTLKPEGFCRVQLCVPLPRGREAEFVQDATGAEPKVNAAAFWRHLGNPVVHDKAGAHWVLGTATEARAAQLRSLEAPDFTLPDLSGRQHSVSEHRGRKVWLASWASW